MDLDAKTDVLVDLTAALHQPESIGASQSDSMARKLTQQALLADTPSRNAQQLQRWSKTTQEMLTILLGQLSTPEVLQAEDCSGQHGVQQCNHAVYCRLQHASQHAPWQQLL